MWRIEPGEPWFATVPYDEWNLTKPSDLSDIFANWNQKWGDRRNEIVIIGLKMNHEEVQKQLEGCLLTDEEFEIDPAEWMEMEDPLEPWPEYDNDEFIE